MTLSVESVIAIIALFVAVPPTITILARFYYQYRSNHVSMDNIELGVNSQDPSIAPAQQSPQNLPRRATLIRMLFEEPGHRQVFEITRGRSTEELSTCEANMPLLENISQITVLDGE